MTMVDLQRRFRELGRLRMGEKLVARSGKPYPSKLSDWRITTASEPLAVKVAEVYGGTVEMWEGAPTEGRQWEVRTGTATLDVLVPPGVPFSQAWELWSGGGCQRRCDGRVQTTGEVCACPADIAERVEASKKGAACKPTTRLSVILPRVPDVGVWRLETHGLNAAVELPGTVDLLAAALGNGVMLPAQLRIDQRTSVKDGETRHFVVPVVELPTVTMAELMSGEGVPSLSAPAPVQIAPPAPAAIGSGGGGDAVASHPRPTPARPPRPKAAPKPPAPTPGGTFARAIAHKARQRGVTDDALAVLVQATAGKALNEISDPGEANAIMAALDAPVTTEAAPVPTLASNSQLRKLHVVGKAIGLDHEDLHGYATATLGRTVESLTDLGRDEIARLIEAAESEADAGRPFETGDPT
jgi:hypothetical protein